MAYYTNFAIDFFALFSPEDQLIMKSKSRPKTIFVKVNIQPDTDASKESLD